MLRRVLLAMVVGAAAGRAHLTHAAEGAAVGGEAIVWRMQGLDAIGGVRPERWGQPRIENGAVVFDGRGDGLLLPLNPLAGWKAFTVEILFRPDADGAAEQRFFHAQERDGGGRRALVELRLDEKKGWWLDTFLYDEAAKRTLIEPLRVHPVGQWFWVALRYDGERMSHWVNGVREAEGAVAFGPMRGGAVSLGVRQTRTYWFKGAIREVRFTPAAVVAEKLQRVE